MNAINREEFTELRQDVKDLRKDFSEFKDNHFHTFQEQLNATHKDFDSRHKEITDKMFQVYLIVIVVALISGANILGKLFLGW